LIYISDIHLDGAGIPRQKRAYVVTGMGAAGTKTTKNFLEQPLGDKVTT
jgi:hypothetical protein